MEGTGAATSALYDLIGTGYARVRRPDPRIARQIHRALGRAATVVNVGAGAGSYEPTDRLVVAVEPSTAMIRQRPPGSAPALRASAEELPFTEDSFDAAMALLTVHHWSDPTIGLAELRRVTRGPIVVLTFDHARHAAQWLVAEYLPSMATLDTQTPAPSLIAEALGGALIEVVSVPHDCTDGFCHAWWRRPDAYLDPMVRAGISGIARLPGPVVDEAMAHLARDLATGRWHQTHQDLLERDEIDAGYRLVIAH